MVYYNKHYENNIQSKKYFNKQLTCITSFINGIPDPCNILSKQGKNLSTFIQ